MVQLIKNGLKTFLPQSWFNQYIRRRDQQQFKEWQRKGSPVPPPHIVKQLAITNYVDLFGCNTLVETGTYFGAMIEAQMQNFKQIISIELDVPLSEKAKQRFRNDQHVRIVQGDSGERLPEIVKGLSSPAIFWLDGHYSHHVTAQGNKDSPILEEFDAILSSPDQHIILIDDARCFNGQGDYPTIDFLSNYIINKNPNYKIEVKDDIIRCIPSIQ